MRNQVKKKRLNLSKIGSTDNTADMLTKALPKQQLGYLSGVTEMGC